MKRVEFLEFKNRIRRGKTYLKHIHDCQADPSGTLSHVSVTNRLQDCELIERALSGSKVVASLPGKAPSQRPATARRHDIVLAGPGPFADLFPGGAGSIGQKFPAVGLDLSTI